MGIPKFLKRIVSTVSTQHHRHSQIHLDLWPCTQHHFSAISLFHQSSILPEHNDAGPTKTNERWWPRVKGHTELCTQVITFTQSSIHIFIARTKFEFRIISHQLRILTYASSRQAPQPTQGFSKYFYIVTYVITFSRTSTQQNRNIFLWWR